MDGVYHIHGSAIQQQQKQQQQHQRNQQNNEQPQQHQQQQPHQPPHQRSSQSATMAPTATMLDPNLGSHVKSSQTAHEFGSPQLQRFAAILNNHQDDLQPMLDHGSSRALPSIEVTDESLDDAYVDFILYCNPAIPTNVDTSELRKGFRSPPKSDGKTFSPFVLFGLISKLEAKEIKTWTQLVIELGVELPDPNKNQSSQKVQQYAVRLKRWLHAFHVDAFFHHCLGISNPYYTDRPIGNESVPEGPRDNVAPEEDLALRALLPEWRPKRGRRKAEDTETENTPSRKAQMRRSASNDFFTNFDEQYTTNPSSAVPWSAQPHGEALAGSQMAIAPKGQNPAQTPMSGHMFAAGQQLRWRLNQQENTPSTPYPQSAIIPRHRYSASPSFEEPPRSANPTSVGKSSSGPSRKRRGPAVSSAWGGSNGVSSGKIRGRPPSNRTFQDGPFSTFPANPSAKEGSMIHVGTPIQPVMSSSGPGPNDAPPPDLKFHETGGSPKGAAAVDLSSQMRKPSKLQLQVPEHAGGPVRLATPPQLLINGESNRRSQSSQELRSSADFFHQLEEDDGSDLMDVDGHADLVDGGDGGHGGNGGGMDGNVDWKRRAMVLKRKLQEKEEELKALKRRVLEAVM